jgi:hypothetical protein
MQAVHLEVEVEVPAEMALVLSVAFTQPCRVPVVVVVVVTPPVREPVAALSSPDRVEVRLGDTVPVALAVVAAVSLVIHPELVD